MSLLKEVKDESFRFLVLLAGRSSLYSDSSRYRRETQV